MKLLCAALLLVALPAWGQVGMDVQPSSATVTLGSQFDVTVRVLANSNQIDGASAYVNYDPAVLFLVSTTPGPTLGTVLQNDTSTPGRVNYSAGTFANYPTTTFVLVTIRFQANALSGGTAIDLNIGPDPRTSKATFGGSDYTTVLSGATITIVAPTVTPTAGTPTQTPGATSPPATQTPPTPCGPNDPCNTPLACIPFATATAMVTP